MTPATSSPSSARQPTGEPGHATSTGNDRMNLLAYRRRYEAPASRASSSLLKWLGASLVAVVALVFYGASADGGPTAADVIALFALLVVAGCASEAARWLGGPLSRIVFVAASTLAALAALAGLQAVTGGTAVRLDDVLVALAAGSGTLALTSLLTRLSSSGAAGVRIAVIGNERSAESLRRELEIAGVRAYTVVGWVSPDSEGEDGDAAVQRPRRTGDLGPLGALSTIVRQHRVDLLLMSGEASRLSVFDEMARSCLHLPVRFCELASFHEDLFGHVPVTEINTSWFQYIMHPRYNGSTPMAKRLLDVAGALVLGIVWLPILLVAAVVIKLDGGPVLFSQTRIGEGGRPFTLYKLRTMRPGTGRHAQWADEDDARVTRVGRILRRTHVDELPQLLNVLRGQMSLVGPRPEQPEFVERLEDTVPFYQRRHLIKPGLTGWAQVRCGYEGSDRGSMWKLSHDLYYLKHRSMALDLAILSDTVLTLLRPKPHVVDAETVGWLFDDPERDALAAPPSGVTPPTELAPMMMVAGDVTRRSA
jgi:exopolysaccharide biosynthesis polyprenyl glycosylphosphotransferase